MPFARRALVALALLVLATAAPAQSGKWPEKPVRVLVPFAAGGVVDILSRLMASRLSEELGTPFIADNRPGAGGAIASEAAVRSAPDGYTVLVQATSYATAAAISKLPFDPIGGIAPISTFAQGPLVLTVNPSVKAANLQELIALAKSKPNSLNIGSQGNGSAGHLVAALLQQMGNIELVHVPYKGDGPALIDLIGGQIQVYFAGPLAVSPHVASGKLRALGVTSERRSTALPDVPALSEQLAGFAVPMWYGMSAPAGTPREIVLQINQGVDRVLKRQDVRDRLRTEGMEPTPSTPDEFARRIAEDIAKWTRVVKAANIRAD